MRPSLSSEPVCGVTFGCKAADRRALERMTNSAHTVTGCSPHPDHIASSRYLSTATNIGRDAPIFHRKPGYVTTLKAFWFWTWNQTHNLQLGTWSIHQLHFVCFYRIWGNDLWGWLWGRLLPGGAFIPASFDVAAALTAPLSVASLNCTSRTCFWGGCHWPSSSAVAPSSPAPAPAFDSREKRWMKHLFMFDGFLWGQQDRNYFYSFKNNKLISSRLTGDTKCQSTHQSSFT